MPPNPMIYNFNEAGLNASSSSFLTKWCRFLSVEEITQTQIELKLACLFPTTKLISCQHLYEIEEKNLQNIHSSISHQIVY